MNAIYLLYLLFLRNEFRSKDFKANFFWYTITEVIKFYYTFRKLMPRQRVKKRNTIDIKASLE
jgi:hypothetical protein